MPLDNTNAVDSILGVKYPATSAISPQNQIQRAGGGVGAISNALSSGDGGSDDDFDSD